MPAGTDVELPPRTKDGMISFATRNASSRCACHCLHVHVHVLVLVHVHMHVICMHVHAHVTCMCMSCAYDALLSCCPESDVAQVLERVRYYFHGFTWCVVSPCLFRASFASLWIVMLESVR
jgi:hypothetical protein